MRFFLSGKMIGLTQKEKGQKQINYRLSPSHQKETRGDTFKYISDGKVTFKVVQTTMNRSMAEEVLIIVLSSFNNAETGNNLQMIATHIQKQVEKLYGHYWQCIIRDHRAMLYSVFRTAHHSFLHVTNGTIDISVFKSPMVHNVRYSQKVATDMEKSMKLKALSVSKFALAISRTKTVFSYISSIIKTQFEREYGGEWTCVVGKVGQFDGDFAAEAGHKITYQLPGGRGGQMVEVILFKNVAADVTNIGYDEDDNLVPLESKDGRSEELQSVKNRFIPAHMIAPEKLIAEALEISDEAMENSLTLSEIAANIQSKFEKIHGRYWQCMIWPSAFQLYANFRVTNKTFIHISNDDVDLIIFKCPSRKMTEVEVIEDLELEKAPVFIDVDMDASLVNYTYGVAQEALQKYRSYQAVSEAIKRDFDQKFRPATWNCFVGEYGSFYASFNHYYHHKIVFAIPTKAGSASLVIVLFKSR